MSKKILVVDDEVELGEVLCDQFETFIDELEANTCCSAEEALSFLRENKVDLVISDIKMPKVTGVELLKKILDEKLCDNVFLMTGYSEYSQEQALGLGARALFHKPGDIQAMIDSASELLNSLKRDKS